MKLVNWDNITRRIRIKELKHDNAIIQALLSGDPKVMSKKYRQSLKNDNLKNNLTIEELS